MPRPDIVRIARPKRLPKHITLFRQGELGQLILGALREAEGELSKSQIVSAVLRAGGHGEGARKAMAQRVRGNLGYLQRREKVNKRVVVRRCDGR
jgi:hypothetical protein